MSVLLVILAALKWLGLALAVLLGLLLVMPLSVRATGFVSTTDELTARGRLAFTWAFGLIGVRIGSGEGAWLTLFGRRVARLKDDGDEPEKSKKKKSKRDKKTRENKPGGRKRGAGWAWQHRETLMMLFRRFVGLFHVRGQLVGAVGFDDPRDTSNLYVFLSAIDQRTPWLDMDVEVDFLDERLELGGQLRSWLVPGQVGVLGLWMLLRRDVRRALWPPATVPVAAAAPPDSHV